MGRDTTLRAAADLQPGDVLALGLPGSAAFAGLVHRIEVAADGRVNIHYFLAHLPHDQGGRNYVVGPGAQVEVVL